MAVNSFTKNIWIEFIVENEKKSCFLVFVHSTWCDLLLYFPHLCICLSKAFFFLHPKLGHFNLFIASKMLIVWQCLSKKKKQSRLVVWFYCGGCCLFTPYGLTGFSKWIIFIIIMIANWHQSIDFVFIMKTDSILFLSVRNFWVYNH